MRISVILPSYKRPHRLKQALDSLELSAGHLETLEVVVAVESDDPESYVVAQAKRGFMKQVFVSEYRNAIMAYNEAARAATSTVLVLGEDDLRFHSGWFQAALSLLDQGYGYIGADNGSQHGCPTNYIATKDWLRENVGGVLCPPIFNQIGDVAMWEIAKKSGAGKFIWARGEDNPQRVFIENLHPYYGKSAWDDTYDKRRQEGSNDVTLYQEWVLRGMKIEWSPVF